MGCDIHACVEKYAPLYEGATYKRWLHAGDPGLTRNYELFAVLADVRNDHGIPPVAEPRGLPEGVNDHFEAYSERWDSDGHSHSYVTLAEMKAYDLNQEYDDGRLIISRDEKGNITGLCGWSSGPTLGPVGRSKVFGVWGPGVWLDLIARLEAVRDEGMTDDDVRLCFFFDN